MSDPPPWGPPPPPPGPVPPPWPQQPWPQQWPPPPPPPPHRFPLGLVVGLCLGSAAALIVAAAVAIVFLGSRVNAEEDRRPRSRIDHWHAAYGVYLCDRYLDPVDQEGDQGGIHTHADGVVHIEPFVASSAGRNAVFRRFEEAERLSVTSTRLRWLDGTVPVQADVADGCPGRSGEAEIASFVDGRRVGGAPGSIRLRDGEVIVIALVPKGTTYDQIGPPPSASLLPRLRGP